MKISFIICSAFFIFSHFVSAQNRCKTPNSKDGNCINLRQCKPLFDMIANSENLSADDRNFLTQSQCGWENKTPLVCCVTESPTVPEQSTSNAPVNTTDSRQGIFESIINSPLTAGLISSLFNRPNGGQGGFFPNSQNGQFNAPNYNQGFGSNVYNPYLNPGIGSFGFNSPNFNQGFGQNGFNSPNQGQGFGQNGFNPPNQGQGFGQNGFNSPNQGQGFGQNGFNSPNQGQGFGQNGFISPNQGQGLGQNGIISPNQGQGFGQNGFNVPNQGQGFNPPNQGQGFGPVGRQQISESDMPQPGTCGTQIEDRIVGGTSTAIGEYPWLALIEYSKGGRRGGYFCGGSLINKDYVLTAAHCIAGSSLVNAGWRATGVRLGEHDLRSAQDCEDGDCADPPVDIRVAETIVHEKYTGDSKLQNDDIALIRLALPVRFTDYIRPVCLPFAEHLKNRRLDRSPLVVTGFGKTETASKSEIKLKVEVDGFNFDRCSELYRVTGLTLIPTQLCAGGKEGEDSCSGDSGGPLMGEDKSNPRNPYLYLAGIVSFGLSECGTAGYPGVYTRVDQYLPWILGHMRG